MSYNSTLHQNHHEKAEWWHIKTKLKCKILKTEKRTHWKPRKEKDYTLKSWLKTNNPKLWVKFALARRTKISRPALKNKHQTKTFKKSQEFTTRESKVSSETRNWNPSTLRNQEQIQKTRNSHKTIIESTFSSMNNVRKQFRFKKLNINTGVSL